MNNKTIKKIKDYEINVDEIQIQELITLGKRIIIQNQINRYSLFDLIRSSIQFTKINTWLIQFILLILTTILITKVINDESFVFVIQCLTIIVIFSVSFFVEEIFRSFTSGMWELEQTLKYDLRQHIIIKLLIFGSVDLLLIVCLSLISQGILAVSFFKIFLYLLVPFNISCIVVFSLLTVWRNSITSTVLWISSGIVLVGVMFLTNFFNVYEFDLRYWGGGYILSLLFLVIIIANNFSLKKWEAFC